MAASELEKGKFQEQVLNKKGMVLVDFHAEWCGPCKMTGPIIEELSNEMKDISFVKIDVDQNQDIASQYSVFSIPTFMIFKDGQVVSQFVGAMGKEGFVDEIQKAKHHA